MDKEVEKIRAIAEACDLSGKELIDFVRQEREEQAKFARDERAFQLELRREDRENLEMKLRIERIKQEVLNASTAEKSTEPVNHSNTTKARAPKLPHFDETKDDIDAYLQRYERYAYCQEWAERDWALNLSALLKGKALEVYSRLALEEAGTYSCLKNALLRRFHLTAQGFKQKFRTAKPERDESAPQFAVRLDNWLTRWIELEKCKKTYEDLKDLLIREQFLNSVDQTLAIFLKERDPKTASEMAKLAEKYCDAHGGFNIQSQTRKGQTSTKTLYESKPQPRPQTSFTKPYSSNIPRDSFRSYSDRTCYICHKTGHIARDCRYKPKNTSVAKIANVIASALTGFVQTEENDNNDNETSKVDEICRPEIIACMMTPHNGVINHKCTKDGFVLLKCGHSLPVMSAACRDRNPNCMPVVKGSVNGKIVNVLRDSGCSGVVIRRDLDQDDQMTGQIKHWMLVDGTVRKAPLARIHIDSPYFVGSSEVLCMTNPVYDLIIGNVLGAKDPGNPDPSWNLDNKTVISETQIENDDTEKVSAVQTRAQIKQSEKPLKKLKVPDMLPEIDQTRIKEAQRNDETLKRVRELATVETPKRNKCGTTTRFLFKDDILYREFTSPKVDFSQTHTQLVVPSKFRNHVMHIAHESILGGHQGSIKTTERVQSNFFWPGVQADVIRFCRSCDICQRTTPKGRISKIPLGQMPLIDTPFQRVAIDIVGPIQPISENGNRYILTLVDYATRYPEAVPLRSIETTRVAEAMVNIFTRVGIPKEILTDQGSQFTSDLMKEISRLLSIKQLTTTPYHPACNGLVERFNGTLKQMLKRLCNEKPRDWDRYIGPLLFAYRETPQSSTGFAPFELLYGRSVRGPMTILKELWTGNNSGNNETRTTYQYILELRNRIEETCKLAQDELRKSAAQQKRHYDRKARARSFKPGEHVLLLLPTEKSKLLLQWKGPFLVIEKVSPYDYRIDMNGKSKVFPANLLKLYINRSTTTESSPDLAQLGIEPEEIGNVFECAQVSVIECESECEPDENPAESNFGNNFLSLPPLQSKESIEDVNISSELTTDQTHNVKRLLGNFRDVMTDLPGTTNLGVHDIKLRSDDPVRSKPYPTPYALTETIKSEVETMLKMNIIEKLIPLTRRRSY